MNLNNPVTEAELQKRATGTRVTMFDIDDNITAEFYFTAADGVEGGRHLDDPSRLIGATELPQSLGMLTFCVIVLKNGFTVTGKSACADPENYNPEIGMRIARSDAVNQIWPLMGYELRSRLSRAS